MKKVRTIVYVDGYNLYYGLLRRSPYKWLNEQAVLCSNDTDLEGALATIRKHHPHLRLGLVAPIPGNDHRRIATDLKQPVDWSKILAPIHLAAAQLPAKIPHTSIRKPPEW